MKRETPPAERAAELRRRAMERLRTAGEMNDSCLSREDFERVVQELQIHRIELEMQNEEMKQARAELETGLIRYAELYDFAPVGYFTLDTAGTILRVNLAGARLLGVHRSPLINRRFTSFVSVTDGSVFSAFLKNVFAGKLNEACEIALLKVEHGVPAPQRSRQAGPDGTSPLVVNMMATASENGQECLAVAVDITERKRSVEALIQAEANYRSIFENAREGIFRTTPEGKILLANAALARMGGYASPEEMMADISDLARQAYVDPEDRARIRELLERQDSVQGYEAQQWRKDGSRYWVSLTMQAVRDNTGRPLYYEGIQEDITERKQSMERMRKALGATVRAIAATVEAKDPYTAGHQRRVADLARSIATEMNLFGDQVDGIRMAGMIHDIGKISVPAEILSMPRKLTDMEFCLIKTHAQSGYDILKDIEFPWPIARMILEHHERMDGSGYPQGLTGDRVLLESRILVVADVVEAMASHRPYRPGLGLPAALEEISRNRGNLYDSEAVDACQRLFSEKGYTWATP